MGLGPSSTISYAVILATAFVILAVAMSINEHNSTIGSLWALNEMVSAKKKKKLHWELCLEQIPSESSVVRVLAVWLLLKDT